MIIEQRTAAAAAVAAAAAAAAAPRLAQPAGLGRRQTGWSRRRCCHRCMLFHDYIYIFIYIYIYILYKCEGT